MAIKDLSLKALRDQINAGTREVTFKTDDGGMTQMVYIPKFRIPVGLWDNGAFPAQDLLLGGFFIDKYQCSHKAATSLAMGIGAGAAVAANSTTDVAVALPGKVAWTDVDWNNAKIACANRKINGVTCHMVTMKEWATVCFLTKLLGHDIRGNNSWGRDVRDSDIHENTGVADPVLAAYTASNGKKISRILTGTGPVSWSHNGSANGVFDIVGNVWEWVDFLINDGVYAHLKNALINDSDGITAADATITIDNMEAGDTWPSTGLIKIESEYITYGAINYQGNGVAILSSCSRAQNGSTAAVHANDVAVQQITNYCVIPNGAVAYIGKTGGLTASDDAVPYTGFIGGPGCTAFAVGDVLQVENEQMIVTAVFSNSLTVTRGANTSTAAVHANSVAIAKISPQMTNYSPSNDPYQYGYLNTLRYEQDLAALALPLVASAQTEEWKDGFYLRNKGPRAALRGGNLSSGSATRSGFALNLNDLPSDRYINIGFRAALTI